MQKVEPNLKSGYTYIILPPCSLYPGDIVKVRRRSIGRGVVSVAVHVATPHSNCTSAKPAPGKLNLHNFYSSLGKWLLCYEMLKFSWSFSG